MTYCNGPRNHEAQYAREVTFSNGPFEDIMS